MPWVRLDENVMDHPKFLALSDGAMRLWVEGLAYCQKHLTDGVILLAALKGFRYFSRPKMKELTTAHAPGSNPLWVVSASHVQVHDYLQWNDSRAQVLEAREFALVRVKLSRDPELRKAIRARDKDLCRYCAKPVNWADRKGAMGATYDHVIPVSGRDHSLENLVIACRSCNSKKFNKTPEQAGMVLLPPPCDLDRDLDPRADKRGGFTSGVVGSGITNFPERTQYPQAIQPVPDELAMRAGRFVEKYAELHEKYRRGARYLSKPVLDFQEALQLVRVWDDERLAVLAHAFLVTDDEWVASGPRTLARFRSRASWCEDVLIEKGVIQPKASGQ